MDKIHVDDVLIRIRNSTDEVAKKLAVASLLGLILDEFLKYTRSRYRLTEDEEWNVLLDAHAKIVRSVERYDPERQSSTGWIVSIFDGVLKDFLRKKLSREKSLTTTELTDEIFEELAEAPPPLDITGRIKRRKKPRKPEDFPDVPGEDTEELITYVLLREEAPLPEDHALWTEKREALQHALRRAHTSDLEILLDPGSRFGPTMTKAQKQALDHVRDLFNEIYYD